MVNSESFGNEIAICTICQQGLDPFADPLQTISICGHVFHEFCLQESFGYFESVKRYSCPICRQTCSPNDAARLYFESVCKSSSEPSLTHTPPPPPPVGDDSEEFRREAKELRKELQLCKQQARKEVAAIKNEAEKQQTAMQEMLNVKSEALAKSSLECSSLQEKNLALAKELAASKLVSNLDLDDKEVLMVTALGNGANNTDRIDVIRKSLVLSNRKRKELMAQCNLLKQGEARLSKKLGKAKGKINRLKTKVQELTDQCYLLERRAESRYSKKLEKAKAKISKLKTRVQDLKTAVEVKKETSPLGPSDLSELMGSVSGTCNDTAQAPSGDIADVLDNVKVQPLARSDVLDNVIVQPLSGDIADVLDNVKVQPLARSDNVILILDDDVNQVQPMLSCTKESPITQPLARSDPVILDGVLNQGQSMLNVTKEYPVTQPFSRPESTYFSGGLIGPDGTKRFLGKWCKRNKKDESATSKNSSTDASHLVIVSDEEGDGENIMQSKRCKYEAKSNSIDLFSLANPSCAATSLWPPFAVRSCPSSFKTMADMTFDAVSDAFAEKLAISEPGSSSIDDLDAPNPNFAVGRLLTKKTFNVNTFQNTIAAFWRMKGRVNIADDPSGRWVFRFQNKRDALKAINGGPWYYKNHNLIINSYDGSSPVAEVPLQWLPIWVNLVDLPMALQFPEALRFIGDAMGKFIDYDHIGFVQNSMRIRILMDVNRPIYFAGEFLIDDIKGSPTFDYEKAFGYCKFCGAFEHGPYGCSGYQTPLAKSGSSGRKVPKTLSIAHVGFEEWLSQFRGGRKAPKTALPNPSGASVANPKPSSADSSGSGSGLGQSHDRKEKGPMDLMVNLPNHQSGRGKGQEKISLTIKAKEVPVFRATGTMQYSRGRGRGARGRGRGKVPDLLTNSVFTIPGVSKEDLARNFSKLENPWAPKDVPMIVSENTVAGKVHSRVDVASDTHGGKRQRQEEAGTPGPEFDPGFEPTLALPNNAGGLTISPAKRPRKTKANKKKNDEGSATPVEKAAETGRGACD